MRVRELKSIIRKSGISYAEFCVNMEAKICRQEHANKLYDVLVEYMMTEWANALEASKEIKCSEKEK